MTFAIILFTQHINVLITKKIEENSKKSDDALSKYDEAQKELQNMNRDFYKIIDAINDYEEAIKEYENVCEQLNEIENI